MPGAWMRTSTIRIVVIAIIASVFWKTLVHNTKDIHGAVKSMHYERANRNMHGKIWREESAPEDAVGCQAAVDNE